jgi:hypothetical protein
MVNIYQLDRDVFPLPYRQDALDAVAKIIEKRMDVNLLFPSRNELMELVKASGGHVRQLMQLTQRACLTASGRNHSQILAEDVEYAIKQLQFSFERTMNKKYFTELAYIALNKDFSDEEDIRVPMLYGASVLEYNGMEIWKYPNPLLLRSNAFKRAIDAIQTP